MASLNPGPQPWNQIAGSFEEQLRIAKRPRESPEELEREHVLDLIAEPLGRLVRSIVREELERWQQTGTRKR